MLKLFATLSSTFKRFT